MREDFEHYIPVGGDGSAAEPDSSSFFMIRALLSSRVDVGLPADGGVDEQNVNIYITHLLCSYIEPEYHMRVAKYLSAYDSTVFDRVRHSTSNRLKYTVYKSNADHLLLSIGVFQNATGRRPNALPAAFHWGEEVHVGRGKTYYDFASTYSQSVFGRSNAVTDVLGKLSARFEDYVKILSHMRGEYLNFVERLSEGEVYHLQRGATSEGVRTLRDEFLDAYSEWRRTPTPDLRASLEDIAARLARQDPTFKFTLPQ